MLWGFIFLCYIEHLTRTAGSLDKHAGTLCSRHQLNREKGSREELPCGVKGQRPLGLPNKHAEEVCSRHQLNRAKGSPEGRRPFGGVKGQCPLRLPLYTKNSYFPCKSTKFEPEFRLNSGGFFFECVLYYMNEGLCVAKQTAIKRRHSGMMMLGKSELWNEEKEVAGGGLAMPVLR